MIDNTGLPDDILLWRYMDFAELMYIVVTKGLYLLRPDQFDDPLEAFCPDASEEEQMRAIRMANVLCWHYNDTESEAMWRLYARDRKNAVAIVIHKGELKTLFDDSFSIERISYIDYRTKKPETDRAFLYKRKSFEHENEIRVVYQSKLTEGAHYVLEQPVGQNGLATLLQRIYVSPHAPERFDITLRGVLEMFGIKATIVPSNDFAKGIRY